ncbi:MAG TPA: glycosyltransferase family 4 protein [Candidatus Dormibacteraeota bacterium]|nr:glycosyltransferase family 4 protein [Candidatus Dormibacteraeota bacterium]
MAGVVCNLAAELRALGHSVTPIFFEDFLPQTRWPARFRTLEFARAIAKKTALLRNDYDVVNIHAPFGFWYGAMRRWRGAAAGPPYVMTMHGLEERRNYAVGREAKKNRADYFRWKNRVWQRLYHMPLYHWSFATAEQSIVLNREAMIYLQLYYNLPPDRVWYVPNGVGKEFFVNWARASGAGMRLLFVGTWIDHKGIYYLAEAFSKVRSVVPSATLTIAGCLEPEERVRRCFDDAVQSSLRVRPFVARAEMPAVYAAHDIFVLPSLMEGMPLVLLEAMASGIAVVTSESCGMTDLVEDEHDGLFAIPGDTESLVFALTRLCNDGGLRERLGRAAQEKMRRYTWARMARRHELIFNRALGITPAISSVDSSQAEKELEARRL